MFDVEDVVRALFGSSTGSKNMKNFVEFISHALSAQKFNSDEWMVKFVCLANSVFFSLGENVRLRYKNGKIEYLGLDQPKHFKKTPKGFLKS